MTADTAEPSMWNPHEERRWRTHTARLMVAAVLVTAVHSLSATTYMSVEPFPHRDVIGEENLARLRGIDYPIPADPSIGSVKQNVLPSPIRLSAQIRPPWPCTIALEM